MRPSRPRSDVIAFAGRSFFIDEFIAQVTISRIIENVVGFKFTIDKSKGFNWLARFRRP